MKRSRDIFSNMSLKGKMGVTMFIALTVSFLAFGVMFTATRGFIDRYFDDESRWKQLTDIKADELQQYVTDNNLSTDDWDALHAWNKRNAGVYVYIYDENDTIYESSRSMVAYSYENYQPLVFSDDTVDMSIFYAIDYVYYTISVITEIFISVLIFFVIMMRMIGSTLDRIRKLENDVKILEGGSLDHVISVNSNDEIGSLEKSLDDMRLAFISNLEKGEELRQANTDLVTRMAHDLRTPLTSLLLYLDLLHARKYASPEDEAKYIHVAQDKAKRIKFMTDQLFERFLISGEKDEALDPPEPVRYILEDPVSSFIMTLEAEGLETVSEIEWPDIKVSVSLNYIERILDNGYSNLLKYADRNHPVVVRIYGGTGEDGKTPEWISLQVSNHIGERRLSAGGSNLGLENIDIMIKRMGGRMLVEDDGRIFSITMILPAVK